MMTREVPGAAPSWLLSSPTTGIQLLHSNDGVAHTSCGAI